MTFNNSAAGYTLSAGSGGSLTLNNSSGTGGSQLSVLAGSHSITAPVTIAGGSLTVIESNNARLLIAGNISDDNGMESLALNGDGSGQLVLSGTNTYGGGTFVEAGTLIVTNPSAIADGTSLTVGNVSAFMAPVVPSPNGSSARATESVPEPGTLMILTVAVCGAALGQCLRSRRRKQ